VQREFREIEGTTVIIYDQTCATEAPPPQARHHGRPGRAWSSTSWCEGCGDCGVQQLPVGGAAGDRVRPQAPINQSTCNKDFPASRASAPASSRSKAAAQEAKAQASVSPFELGALPEPSCPIQPGGAWGIVVAGVGGTGVITIGQLLGMAAHMEGKGVVTQDAAGLAQKGGATWSHVQIGASQDDIRTTRVTRRRPTW
jgi:indolepyruvate ferredoxin oxidoreductase